MAKEIERKFLVINDSYKSLAYKKSYIRQGYLSKDIERTVRIRIIDEEAYLTIKGKNYGIERLEFEYKIPIQDAEELLKISIHPLIKKYRYYVKQEHIIWEIDQFCDSLAPLVVAEVELPSCDTILNLPPFIGREVSGNPQYYNSNM